MVGGGGVGKTTTTAALGLARARQGERVLVVTVDPARRLADALGVTVGSETSRILLDGIELHVRMPDPRRAVDQFAEWLFSDDPVRGERVRHNPLYRELSDALLGMYELVTTAIIDQELGSGQYDQVVLDTAPSRHALDFIDSPGRLLSMLEARTLRWAGQLGRHAGASLSRRPTGRGLLGWGKRRMEALVANLIGVPAVRDTAEFFVDLVAVRERWLGVLRSVERRLRASDTRFWVVAGPSGAALDDAEYLVRELERRNLPPDRVLINRMVHEVPEWLTVLHRGPGSELCALVQDYLTEHEALVLQARRARERMGRLLAPGTPLACLPLIRTSDPAIILRILADALGPGGGLGASGSEAPGPALGLWTTGSERL
jgi:anion-transporting  ArsA/GET3 family ATPase